MQTEVYCYGCKDSHPTKELEILRVDRNEEGHDVMTFFCANTQYKGISSVRTRTATKSGGWF
jgi:hypothetical protein